MHAKRSIAAAAVATTVLAALGVAGATSAMAADDGAHLTGNVYFLKAGPVGLAAAVPSDQVTGGTYAGRPFATIAVDQACPDGTAQMQILVREKTPAVETDWNELALTGSKVYTTDADGHVYVTATYSNFIQTELQDYLTTTEHVAAGDSLAVPLAVVCENAGGSALGYFSTDVMLQANPTTAGVWSQVAPTMIEAPKTATNTTLGTVPASIELGDTVSLSATVDQAGATGDVEYFDGATSLGTSPLGTPLAVTSSGTTLAVGTHSITAEYLGDDSYAESTSAAASLEVTAVAPRGTTTTLSATPLTGEAYQQVSFTVTVTAAGGHLPNGTVAIKDGSTVVFPSVPCVNGVVNPDANGIAKPLTTNQFGAGNHTLVAYFTGSAPYTDSDSAAAPVAATYTSAGSTVQANAKVALANTGAILITTPYVDQDSALDLGTLQLNSDQSYYTASATIGSATDPAKAIKITDERAGTTGWSAKIQVNPFSLNGSGSSDDNASFNGSFAGLTFPDPAADKGKPATNGLNLADLVLTDHPAQPNVDDGGLSTLQVFAKYTPSDPQYKLGTAFITGQFSLEQVPTSLLPGTYWATLVFTAN